MQHNYDQARENAMTALFDNLEYLKSEMQKARESGNTKAVMSMTRQYLPAQKEYLRLLKEQDYSEYTDSLIDFVNSGKD